MKLRRKIQVNKDIQFGANNICSLAVDAQNQKIYGCGNGNGSKDIFIIDLSNGAPKVTQITETSDEESEQESCVVCCRLENYQSDPKRVLFTATSGGKISAWNVSTGKPVVIDSFENPEEVLSIEIYKNLLFFTDDLGSLKVLCFENQKKLVLKRVFGNIKINSFYVDKTFSVGQDARRVYISGDSSKSLGLAIDTRRLKLHVLNSVKSLQSVNCTAYAPKRQLIYFGTKGKVSSLYNSKSNKRIAEILLNEDLILHGCDFAKNEDFLFVGYLSGLLIQFCLESRVILHRLTLDNSILTIIVAPDDKSVYIGTWDSDNVYEAKIADQIGFPWEYFDL